jgi:hypothetical protein
MKLIVRLDLANILGLALTDGSRPKALRKGDVVELSESELDRNGLKIFGNLLVPVDSEAGQRALLEADFEREKATKVKALLKKMGAKTVSEARGTEQAGFLNQFERAKPHLVELMDLLRQVPPPPEKPSFVKTLFKSFP